MKVDREEERAARLAFISATKNVVALTYQLELVTDLLKRLYGRLADTATKLGIAVDLCESAEAGNEEDG